MEEYTAQLEFTAISSETPELVQFYLVRMGQNPFLPYVRE